MSAIDEEGGEGTLFGPLGTYSQRLERDNAALRARLAEMEEQNTTLREGATAASHRATRAEEHSAKLEALLHVQEQFTRSAEARAEKLERVREATTKWLELGNDWWMNELHAALAKCEEGGCTCQGCGRKYTLDVSVPDAVWERIKPEGKPEGAGLLCPQCITNRLLAGCEEGK